MVWSILFSTSYLISTEFPWTISLPSWTKGKGHEEDIDPHEEEEESDEVGKKLRICDNEDSEENREKSEELHIISGLVEWLDSGIVTLEDYMKFLSFVIP